MKYSKRQCGQAWHQLVKVSGIDFADLKHFPTPETLSRLLLDRVT